MIETELPVKAEVVVDYLVLHTLLREHGRVLLRMDDKAYAKLQVSCRRYGWKLSRHERGWMLEPSGVRATAKLVVADYAM